MLAHALILKAEVQAELKEIEQSKKLITKNLDLLDSELGSNSEYFHQVLCRDIGFIIHSIYTGYERILKRIIKQIDGYLPEGGSWHRELLNRSTLEIPGIRPPIINKELSENLEELLGFRHALRNLYIHQLKEKRIRELARLTIETFPLFQSQIEAFFANISDNS